jgi:hypothetical protein
MSKDDDRPVRDETDGPSADADGITEVLSPAIADASPEGRTPPPAFGGSAANDAAAHDAAAPVAAWAVAPSTSRWDDEPVQRPRVRVGAIVWGVLVAAFAALVLTISTSPVARTAFDGWRASLSPTAWLLIGVIAIGVVVLLIAGVSAIRGAQRRSRTSTRP